MHPLVFLCVKRKAFAFTLIKNFYNERHVCPFGDYRRSNHSTPPSILFDFFFYADIDYYESLGYLDVYTYFNHSESQEYYD